MMEDQENHIQIDPKIVVALISALVSVVSAAIPILSDAERNFFLVAFAFLLALILMGVCVYILFRDSRLFYRAACKACNGLYMVARGYLRHDPAIYSMRIYLRINDI